MAGRETSTYQSGLKGNTFQRRDSANEVQELTPESLWLPGVAISVRGGQPRASNAAERESGPSRISRERVGDSVEGPNGVGLRQATNGSDVMIPSSRSNHGGSHPHGWQSWPVHDDQRVMSL